MKRDSRLYFPEVIKNTYLARGNVIFQVSLTFSTGMDIHSLTITMDWQNGVIVDETLDNSVAEIDNKDNVDEIQVNFESQTNVDEICCLICSKVLKNKESLRKHQQVNQIELVMFVTKNFVPNIF